MEGTLSGGKKWASGTATLKYNMEGFNLASGTSLHTYCVEVTLSFIPSTIIVNSQNSSDTYEYTSVYNNQGNLYGTKNIKFSKYYKDSSYGETYLFKCDSKIELGNNVYRIPLATNDAKNIKWIAYE